MKNIKNAPEAFKAFLTQDSIKMFEEFNVYRKEELISRYNIKLEKYIKNIKIEAEVMIEMAKQDILPQTLKYAKFLEETVSKLETLKYQKENLQTLIQKINELQDNVYNLEKELQLAEKCTTTEETAKYFSDRVKYKMDILREIADTLEEMLPKEYWPMPTYSDMLNS